MDFELKKNNFKPTSDTKASKDFTPKATALYRDLQAYIEASGKYELIIDKEKK